MWQTIRTLYPDLPRERSAGRPDPQKRSPNIASKTRAGDALVAFLDLRRDRPYLMNCRIAKPSRNRIDGDGASERFLQMPFLLAPKPQNQKKLAMTLVNLQQEMHSCYACNMILVLRMVKHKKICSPGLPRQCQARAKLLPETSNKCAQHACLPKRWFCALD